MAKVGSTERLTAWLQGKPFLIGSLALTVAGAAEEIIWMLGQLRRRSSLGRLPPPPPGADWRRLYRRHREVFRVLGDVAGVEGFDGVTMEATAAFFREMSRREVTAEEVRSWYAELSADEHSDIVRLARSIRHAGIDAPIETLRREALGLPVPEEASIAKAIHAPHLQYHLRVWLPCWIEYRTYPVVLLHRARAGDIEALEKLLRIDKGALYEPGIVRQIHLAATAGHGARLDRIGDAVKGGPVGRFSRAKVKKALVSLISSMAAQLKQPLTEADIRGLFDAVAATRGAVRDRDLPLSSEALSKAIQRERRTWPKFGGGQKS